MKRVLIDYRLVRKALNDFRLFFVLFVALFSVPQFVSAATTEREVAAITPIIALLLMDDEQGLSISVGQTLSRTFSHDDFPNGLDIDFNSTDNDVVLSINVDGIEAGSNPSIFLNGRLLGGLKNGRNSFLLRSSDIASLNRLRIGRSDGSSGVWVISSIQLSLASGPQTRAEAQRFLMRATFGPTLAELNRVTQVGYEAWIEEQFIAPQTNTVALWNQFTHEKLTAINADRANAGLPPSPAINLDAANRFRTRMDTWWQASLQGEDQLRQRVAYALAQIFNVSEDNPDLTPFYHDILANNAFSNYYDILRNVALSPKMGTYLGMLGNKKARTGNFPTVPDENFAREVMQLFSIGLLELNIDGSLKLVDGEPVETYDIETVRSFARVFTGWRDGGVNQNFQPGWQFVPMRIWQNGADHDFGSKILLRGGVNQANLSAQDDFDKAMLNIFEHPNVGPFVSKQMIQRLVKSNPSPAYIARVASAFNDNGLGTRGDMQALIRAILLDQEALEGHLDSSGGKMKEPILALTQLWRAFEAQSDQRYFRYTGPARAFGQKPFDAPTVFGFYEPDFVPQGPLEDAGLVAPEFNLLTDNVVVRSINQLAEFVSAQTYGIDPIVAGGVTFENFNAHQESSVQLDLSEIKAFVGSSDNDGRLVEYLNERLLGGLMSPKMNTLMRQHLSILELDDTAVLNGNLIPDLDPRLQARTSAALLDLKVREAIRIVVMSPEYLTQR